MDNRLGFVDYSRQKDMEREIKFNSIRYNNTIHIVGCGGIGFWVGIHAALLGFNNFYLYDNDLVDSSNLNRLPINQCWIGKHKVLALRATIKQMRPDAVVVAIKKRVEPTFFPAFSTSIVIDCTDVGRTQSALCNRCKELMIQYEKIGYEGFNIGAYTDTNMWYSDDTTGEEEGYRTSSANSLSSSFSAIIGLLKIMCELKGDININMLKMLKERLNK